MRLTGNALILEAPEFPEYSSGVNYAKMDMGLSTQGLGEAGLGQFRDVISARNRESLACIVACLVF